MIEELKKNCFGNRYIETNGYLLLINERHGEYMLVLVDTVNKPNIALEVAKLTKYQAIIFLLECERNEVE